MMDIDSMTGKELAIALAEQVMGWQEWDPHKIEAAGTDLQAVEECYPCWRDMGPLSILVLSISATVGFTSRLWAPWEYIADAWEVVEKIHSLGSHLRLHHFSNGYSVEFVPMHGNNHSIAESVKEAICRAALKAVT